jgi:TatD DNase family protein
MVTISTRVARFSTIRAIAEPMTASGARSAPIRTTPTRSWTSRPSQLAALADHPKVVAIGEAGLDYHYDKSPRDRAGTGLRTHIAAARLTGLPLVIHAREADDDIAAILTEEMGKGAFKAVLHCFHRLRELARPGVALGLYVSFSGIATFKSAANLREVAATAPADRILVETDAPYLAPGKFRGKTNEPSFVVETGESASPSCAASRRRTIARPDDREFLSALRQGDPGRACALSGHGAEGHHPRLRLVGRRAAGGRSAGAPATRASRATAAGAAPSWSSSIGPGRRHHQRPDRHRRRTCATSSWTRA